MKKTKYILIVFLIVIIIAIIVYFCKIKKTDNINNNLNYSKHVNIIDENDSLDTNNIREKEKISKNKIDSIIFDNNHTETEISTFSTDRLDDSPGRLTNIRITCDNINNTVVDPGKTFSFNEIVGQPSVSKGYQEAPIIVDGEHETGIGGRKLSSK